jgi:hypothetical protein
MKLGVSYNVFDDSIELLETSIKLIRGNVDYISIIYQNVSNYGVPSKISIKPILDDLLKNNLIDEYYLYNPNIGNGTENECNKRNIGLSLSIKNICNYHMSMDSDEFYLKNEFNYLIDFINKNPDIESYYCNMKTYYKDVNYQLNPSEEYFVSLFYKIKPDINFVVGTYTPVCVDPTRRINCNSFKIFDRNEIEMHHMSYVRNDIRHKLQNSSALINYSNKVNIIVDYYNQYKYPMKALLAGVTLRTYNIIKTNYNWYG